MAITCPLSMWMILNSAQSPHSTRQGMTRKKVQSWIWELENHGKNTWCQMIYSGWNQKLNRFLPISVTMTKVTCLGSHRELVLREDNCLQLMLSSKYSLLGICLQHILCLVLWVLLDVCSQLIMQMWCIFVPGNKSCSLFNVAIQRNVAAERSLHLFLSQILTISISFSVFLSRPIPL